ncbi:hypothetical protein B7Z28_02100 [Candidatus Saccharibacteria bacterium 32-45-3]|nr:MAG: hypothetical protein B7Z28_02100 [Candidatus Saccharibacteria bacterium 32-45-3]
MIYALTVDGTPRCWKRPKSTRHGGLMFNPSAPQQAMFRAACTNEFLRAPLEGPLKIELLFLFPREHYHFDHDGQILPGAPRFYGRIADVDNLIKFALDAMIGAIYVDDAQVMEIKAVKRYADGMVGRTTVFVETL